MGYVLDKVLEDSQKDPWHSLVGGVSKQTLLFCCSPASKLMGALLSCTSCPGHAQGTLHVSDLTCKLTCSMFVILDLPALTRPSSPPFVLVLHSRSGVDNWSVTAKGLPQNGNDCPGETDLTTFIP